MARLLKNIVLVTSLTMLAACSANNANKRQINDDDSYINSNKLIALTAIEGSVLPAQFSTYATPLETIEGKLGKELDIRSPQLPLALFDNSRAQLSETTVSLLLNNSRQSQDVWLLLNELVNQHQYPLLAHDNENISTDWISVPRLDEDTPYQARYHFKWVNNDYQNALNVTASEVRHNDEMVSEPAIVQRYSVIMFNQLVTQIKNSQANRAVDPQSKMGSYPIQSGTDETGLPIIVIRAPYANVWQRLPQALENIGMKVEKSNRSQGTVEVKYREISDAKLDSLGLTDLNLKNAEYVLQVGDLNNRTSIQLRSSKGQPVKNEQNETLRQLIDAALNQGMDD